MSRFNIGDRITIILDGSKRSATVTQVNEDGTLELAVLIPGSDRIFPVTKYRPLADASPNTVPMRLTPGEIVSVRRTDTDADVILDKK